VRLFTLFKAPPEQVLEWDISQIQGQHRWVSRVWNLVHSYIDLVTATPLKEDSTPAKHDLLHTVHRTIKRVTDSMSIEEHAFNVAIAELMKLSNVLSECTLEQKSTITYYQALRSLILMLAPIAPHLSAELWLQLVQAGPKVTSPWCGTSDETDVTHQQWPVYDNQFLTRTTKTVSIQVSYISFDYS
jgi:leucyl-tRNA synthetase